MNFRYGEIPFLISVPVSTLLCIATIAGGCFFPREALANVHRLSRAVSTVAKL